MPPQCSHITNAEHRFSPKLTLDGQVVVHGFRRWVVRIKHIQGQRCNPSGARCVSWSWAGEREGVRPRCPPRHVRIWIGEAGAEIALVHNTVTRDRKRRRTQILQNTFLFRTVVVKTPTCADRQFTGSPESTSLGSPGKSNTWAEMSILRS